MATARDILIVIRLQDEATRGLRALGRELSGLGSSAGLIATGVAAATGALAAAVGAVGALGIGFNSMKQQAEIGLGFVVRNTELARDMIGQLLTFARNNPVPVEPLINAARVLAGYGYEAAKIVPTLKAIADANSAIGGTTDTFNRIAYAIAQVVAKGRVQAEEVRQLANAGIPALAILAEKTGKTQADLLQMMKTGKLGAESVGQLIEGIQQRFTGALAAQADTLVGALTVIRNIAKEWAGLAFGPVFDQIQSKLIAIRDFMQGPGFLQSAQVVANAFTMAFSVIDTIPQRVASALSAISRPTLRAGGGEGEAGTATQFDPSEEIRRIIANIQGEWTRLVNFYDAYVKPGLGAIWQWIVDTIDRQVLPAFFRFRDWVITTFQNDVMPVVHNVITSIGNELERFGPWVQGTLIPALENLKKALVDPFIAMIGFIQKMWPYIQPVLMEMLRKIGLMLANLRDVIAIIFAALAGDWEGAWNLLRDVAVRILEGLIDDVAAIIRAIIQMFVPLPDSVLKAVQGRYTGIGSRRAGSVSPIFGGGEGEEIGGVASMSGGTGGGGFSDWINGLLKGIGDVTTGLKDTLNGADVDLSLFDDAITESAGVAGRAAKAQDDYLKLVEQTNKDAIKASAWLAEQTFAAAEAMEKAKQRIENYFLGEFNRLVSSGMKFSDQSFKVWAGAAGLNTDFPGPTTYWSSDNPGVPSLTPYPGQQAVNVTLSPDLAIEGVP